MKNQEKNYDITIKEFYKTNLPEAEAPEIYVMNSSINFSLSEKEFKYLVSKLNEKDSFESNLINKLKKLIK